METRTYCAYNASKECFLSPKVTEADSALQPLRVLDLLIGGLGLDSEMGIWLTPLKGSPTIPRLFPFDLLYLSKDLHVIQAVEMFPGGEFPPVSSQIASALVLPLHATSSSQTAPGDRLFICQEEELAQLRADSSIATTPAREAVGIPVPALVSRARATQTPELVAEPAPRPRISIQSARSRSAPNAEFPLELFPGSPIHVSSMVVSVAPIVEIEAKQLPNLERPAAIFNSQISEPAETETAIPPKSAIPPVAEAIPEPPKPVDLPAELPSRLPISTSPPVRSSPRRPMLQNVQFTVAQYPKWSVTEPTAPVPQKTGPLAGNGWGLQATKSKTPASAEANRKPQVDQNASPDFAPDSVPTAAASKPPSVPSLSKEAPTHLFPGRLVEPMTVVFPISASPALPTPTQETLNSLASTAKVEVDEAELRGAPTSQSANIETEFAVTEPEIMITEPKKAVPGPELPFVSSVALSGEEPSEPRVKTPTGSALVAESVNPKPEQGPILQIPIPEPAGSVMASAVHTEGDVHTAEAPVPSTSALLPQNEAVEAASKSPTAIDAPRKKRAIPPPDDAEAPHFYTPTPLRFFDPNPDAEAIAGGEAALVKAPVLGSTVSGTLSAELRAAIQRLDEQVSETRKVKDRSAARDKEKGRVKAKAAKAEADTPKAKTAPVLLEKPNGKPAVAAQEQLSLTARFARWVEAGGPTAHIVDLDPTNRRRAPRRQQPGLVAYYWSGGPPQPQEIANISQSGFYLFTKDRWIPETMLRMTIQRQNIEEGNPRHAIVVLAKVIRADADGVGYEFVLPETLNRKTRDVLPDKVTDRRALEHFL